MDPRSPASSAPHHAKRTALVTGGALPSRSAISSWPAEPDPLSLIPGPAGTESRCAPAMTTSSARPVVVWAMTLRVTTDVARVASTSVTGVPARAARASPSAWSSPPVGTRPSATAPRVPPRGPGALLDTSTAAAPASAAICCFWVKEHTPRCTRTTAPRTGRFA